MSARVWTPLIFFFGVTCALASAQQGFQPGADRNRLVLAVVGDGYAKADQEKYKRDVEKYVTKGALQHAGYAKYAKAFTVQRIDAVQGLRNLNARRP